MDRPPSQTQHPIGKIQVPLAPWAYFALFCSANSLISFMPLSLPAKLWIGLAGILLPLIVGLQTAWVERRRSGPSGFLLKDIFPIPSWAWLLFLSLLLWTRFDRLTTLPFWPVSDEGITGFLGMGQSRHWEWRLLWTGVQTEPLTFWVLGLVFKIFTPSLFLIRLFPTLISLATVFAAFWAASRYVPRALAFFFAWLVAFSFWEFTLARLCIPVIWGPLWECLCLGFFAKWLKAENPKSKRRYLLTWALWTSVGFYTWSNWGGF
jgi:hypothetical protein